MMQLRCEPRQELLIDSPYVRSCLPRAAALLSVGSAYRDLVPDTYECIIDSALAEFVPQLVPFIDAFYDDDGAMLIALATNETITWLDNQVCKGLHESLH